MAETNDLLAAIEAIHAAGLDAELWPQALTRVAGLVTSSGATLEVYELPSGRLLELHAFGIPPAEQLDYFEHYAAINPRAAYALRRPLNELLWDYQVLDEAAMDRDPYYSELLPRTDFRYFLSGNLFRTPRQLSIATVQRTRAQGHVEAAEIALMRQLVPHFRQALEVATRLKHTVAVGRSLESTLDWLADGVALLGRDGAVLYANEALQEIFRRRDGIAIKKGALGFPSPEARTRFAEALNAIARLRDGDSKNSSRHDFPVARPANAPPYLVSLRPLARSGRGHNSNGRAVAIAFVRDTLRRDATGISFLIELFGLTPAEAGLARAIQAGVPLDQYARGRAVSLNTVYTHLRRVKEKTHSKRMSELIRALNDLQVPLRPD